MVTSGQYASYWNAFLLLWYIFPKMFTQQDRPLPSLATITRETSAINSFTQLKTRNHSSRCFIMNKFEHVMGEGRGGEG